MKAGIRADAIHGNKSQSARQIALINFKTGKLKVLVSRGIDVDALEHAINFDLPDVPETYVHHIGRTRREGTNGSAIFFAMAGKKMSNLKSSNKLIGLKILAM
jgi:ATP-dependent RNA helicase RhlE